jgi:hypothetical protein
MFTKPNEVVIRQLTRLNSQEFSHLTSFFEEELLQIDQRLRRAEDKVYAQLQGRAIQMEELLDLIRKAPAIRDRPSPPNTQHTT